MSTRSPQAVGLSNMRKGKTAERRVAALLTKWAGTEFRRRRVEGRDGATLRIDSASDVIPVAAPNFPFSVEVKSGGGFSLHAILTNPIECLFGKWWFQACYDAQLMCAIRQRSVYPMLFFKPSRPYDWVAVSTKALPLLQPYPHIPPVGDDLWFPHLRIDEYGRVGSVQGNVSHSPKHKQIVTIRLESVVICPWSTWALNVDPISLLV